MPGYPIRTPWDHSSVDSSPRPIAASHVLHRLLVPRHPPFALDNLTTENKMLASTVQFSTNDQPTTHTTPTSHKQHPPTGESCLHGMRARLCLALKATPPRTISPEAPASPARLFFQDPTGCYTPHTSRTTTLFLYPPKGACTKSLWPLPAPDWPVSPPLSTPTRHSRVAGSWTTFAV